MNEVHIYFNEYMFQFNSRPASLAFNPHHGDCLELFCLPIFLLVNMQKNPDIKEIVKKKEQFVQIKILICGLMQY